MEHKKQLFYIHGGTAFSDYKNYLKHLKAVPIEAPITDEDRPVRWTDRLREQMGEEWEVFMPKMPGKGNCKYEEWKIWFERHFEWLNDDLILLGWSQGGYFLAKYLLENKMPVRVKGIFLMAAPFEPANFGEEDGGDFNFDTKKVAELAKKAENIFIFHSEDDPIVPFEHAKKYHDGIPGSVLMSFKTRNHFLIEEFPELIEKIKTLYKNVDSIE